jgi:hypothetical protein
VAFGGSYPVVVDVEAVGEEECRVRLEVRSDLLLVELRLRAVGDEERDELRAADGVGDGRDREAGVLGRGPRGAALAQADDDVDAGVVEVEGMRMPLAPVPDDGDLAVQEVDVAVLVDLGL